MKGFVFKEKTDLCNHRLIKGDIKLTGKSQQSVYFLCGGIINIY